MMARRTVFLAAIAAMAIFLFVITGLYKRSFNMSQRIHVLTQPLMLEGSTDAGHNYLLPAGTTLYYDQAFPEGFIRYRIYLNVEGVNLPSEILADPTEIRPISAYPVDKSSLIKLLKEYPVTKSELASILKSGELSKQDIREVLIQFSD